MPLSRLQGLILTTLAAHRDPESYVAGGTVLNRSGPRISQDIDIFHDREAAVAQAAARDAETLDTAGFGIEWLRREPGLHAAIIQGKEDATRLEWARDSDFRHFAAVPDALFGYRLHLLDLATNKALAAAGRREPRDVLDLLHVHERHLPLGAVIWAAVAKDPGFSPESLIGEIRRNARYRADDYADLQIEVPVNAGEVSLRMKRALREAETFISAMPRGQEGLVYLHAGRVVQPEPDRLATYRALAGRRGGHWPSSPDIAGAMMEP